MSRPTLLGISGSLRAASTNRKLLREAARVFGDADYIEADVNFPLYDGDLEADEGIPAAVQALSDQIAAADAVLISGPEYNKGISGVLKNALDWVSRTEGNPWADKPVAIMSAAAGRAGGERTQVMLRMCLYPFRPRLLQGPEVLVAASADQFDDQGRLQGEMNVKTLNALIEALKAEMAR
ncbi:NADPH-dependent FMN reductase [Lutimaribacter saemankumensis]|uniref:Chromate reductase n=1 Tax=Lutimaribacter saemankumensis TaxID=490829 RepID=A0A1G8PA68_9RHOB|nr:NADPH-dependent FMN reductase [Lutimaribacter saemankumensis]SDI89399.1 chromate reductase [Lutimaribacter saemankumensis]